MGSNTDTSLHILVIEDNPGISKLIEFKLKKANYKVSVRDNGFDGLDAARTLNPDLLILDVMLPGMTGFEILEELRKDEATKELKVVMLTSKAKEEDIRRGFEYNVVDYMDKPFKVGELLIRLERILG